MRGHAFLGRPVSSTTQRVLALIGALLLAVGCDDEESSGSADTGDMSADTAADTGGDGDGSGAAPGEVLWSRDFDARYTNITQPSFGPNGETMIVAVGFGAEIDEPSSVHRIDPATGDNIWEDDTLVSVGGGPCVITPNGTCWLTDIQTGSTNLIALSLDGETLHDIPLTNAENPHVEGVQGDDAVLTQTWFVGLEAFDQSDGTSIWLDADSLSDNKRVLAISADGTAWIGQTDLGIYQRTAAGAEGWSSPFESAPCEWRFEASALTADGSLVAGCSRPTGLANVWLLDADGQETGLLTIPGEVTALALAADGGLFIGTSDGLLHTDPTGEQERWRSLEGSLIFGLSVGDSGTVYGLAIGSAYQIFALDPDGELAWEFGRDGVQFTSWPTLGPNGTLYVTVYLIEGGRTLYALATESGGLATDSAWPTVNRGYGRTRQAE